ncbi:unnamed protein product, partial [Cuscuta epithymum]
MSDFRAATPAHYPDPATSKKKSKTAPRLAINVVVPRPFPVNHLRRISSHLPFREVAHPSANFFIPCFGMMFNFLAAMNDKVCSLPDFSCNGCVNDWIPQASNIVFAFLAIVQCLRAQALTMMISPEQICFLNRFLDQFPLGMIEIPGPLVPFFRSLSISSPGFGNFRDVAPALPVITLDEERLYNMEFQPPCKEEMFQGLTSMVPNIALMYDQFVHLLKYLDSDTALVPRKYATYEPLSKIFGVSLPPDGDAKLPYFSRLLKSVGFAHRPNASDGLMSRFFEYIRNASIAFPAPLTYDPEHASHFFASNSVLFFLASPFFIFPCESLQRMVNMLYS